MSETNVTTSPAARSRKWPKVLGLVLGLFVLLVIGLYFVATSASFFKGVILPRASKALNAEITVEDASISPFSEVVLRNLKVRTTGEEPLLVASEVRARYKLMDIIRGNAVVQEVNLSSPTVTLVENPDGTTNLDPLLKKQEAKEEPKKPSGASRPPQLDIGKVTLSNGTLRRIKLYSGNRRDTAEISKLTLNIENIKNGQTGKLALEAALAAQNNRPTPGASGSITAAIKGGFDFALSKDLAPESIKGSSQLQVSSAQGAFAQANGLSTELNCDLTPAEIKQLSLDIQKSRARLGQLRLSGPFSMEKSEGRLQVELLSIDKQVLNLAGAAAGIDFGTTTLSSTNLIELQKAGKVINADGRLDLAKFQLIQTNQTTPTLDLSAAYNVTVDLSQSNALVRALSLNGMQQGNRLLSGQLTSPMSIPWGGTSAAMGDSAFNLTLTNLNFADWKPFLGAIAPAGILNAQAKVLSQQSGNLLTFDVDSRIENLTVKSGTNSISSIGVRLTANGTAANMKQFKLNSYGVQLARQNQSLLSTTGSGTYDRATETADLQVQLQAALPRLLELAPQADLNITSGTAELKARITQKDKAQNVTGGFVLANLTGRAGANEFRSFGATADVDFGMTPQQLLIRKATGSVSEGGKPGGAFDLSGNYHLTNRTAQLNAQLRNFNQTGLRPFLEPMLAGKTLSSVSLSATAAATYDPNGASSVKADLSVTNLIVNDPKGQFPATPLEARVAVDASVQKDVADIRQCQLALTPTKVGTNQVQNQLQLTGKVDMSRSNAITGNLKLSADSLDLTRYYDLFAGGDTGGKVKSTEQKPTSAATPEQEPPARSLPFKNFVVDAAVGKIYLRELEISGLQAVTKLDGGRVVLNPLKLQINGAPVSSTIDFDMGVPGYKYDVAFNAQSVPLTPLVNSFVPERKGQLGGTVTAATKVNGAGMTWANQQKSLTGQFDIGTTNLNLSVVNIKSPLLRTLVNVVATIPELIRNPENALTSLLGTATGSGGGRGGLTSELERSPIDKIVVRGTLGSARLDLQQGFVQSPAFQAEATGTANLAPVLTNSTIQFPVNVALSRSVADRISLTSPNTPTNAAYVPMPKFLTMRGTLGKPKTDIDKLALGGTVLKSLGNLPIGGEAGKVIQGLNSILGGPQATNAPAQRSAPPPATKSNNLLQSLGGLLTAPPTNAPAARGTNPPSTNQSPVDNLLNDLLKPKKK